MSADQTLETLWQVDGQKQIDLAFAMIRSGKPCVIEALLEILEQPDEVNPDLISAIHFGVIEGEPATVGPVVNYLLRSPLSRAGRDCAYLLGEIALRQQHQRDTRIVLALVAAIQASLSANTWAAPEAIGALRECARSGPVPDADAVLLALLTIARQEPEPYSWVLRTVIEILFINRGQDLLPLLKAQVEELRPDHNLAIIILSFLDGADATHTS
jgi:hypothetical protein